MLDHGWAPGTRKNCVILLTAVMRHAKKMGKMQRNLPEFADIRLPKKRPKFFIQEQEADILEFLTHIGDEDLHDLCIFLADTGLRSGKEALPLRWDATNFQGEIIQVWEGKGGKHRSVPMTARVRKLLRQRKLRHGNAHGPFGNTTYHACQQR